MSGSNHLELETSTFGYDHDVSFAVATAKPEAPQPLSADEVRRGQRRKTLAALAAKFAEDRRKPKRKLRLVEGLDD